MTEIPHKRSYKVGRRNDKNIPKQTPGKMSKNRWAWCRVYFGQFVIWGGYKPDHPDEIEDIKLVYPIPNRAAVTWNLTACTEEELDAIEDIITTAIAWARPICIERDREARDAFEQGDDSYERIYRAVPTVVYRPRPEREHSESVLDGSEDAAPVSQQRGDSSPGLRDTSSDLAEQDEAELSSEDDWSEADLAEGVRQVGTVEDGPLGVQGADPSQDDPSSDPRDAGGPGAPPPSVPQP